MTQTVRPLQPLPDYGTTLVVKGSQEPRISTPPLRELTPETSYGFAVIEFARDVLEEPLLEWQANLVIRIGELLSDGKPRFKKILILIARQNGKTHLVKVLAAYWMAVERVNWIAGTSSTLKMAKEAWSQTYKAFLNSPVLAPLIARYRTDNTDPHFATVDDSKYMPTASNDSSLRGFTIDRLIIDELRKHKDYRAWDSAIYTVRTKPYSQVICISNAGSDESTVLNDLRTSAIEYIDSNGFTGDQRLGLFEWSADRDDDPMLPETWAKANPSMGLLNPVTRDLVLDPADIYGDAVRATATGGEALSGFLTEVLCMHVPAMDNAISPSAWKACAVAESKMLPNIGSKSVWAFDVNYNGDKAVLLAAVDVEGTVQVDVIKEWRGSELNNVVADLTRLGNKYKPTDLLYVPTRASATYIAALRDKALIRGTKVRELRGDDISAAAMGFADAVAARRIQHSNDELLTDHALGAEKKRAGDRWTYTRARGKGSVHALYAAAAAWYGTQTQGPAPDFTMYTIKPKEGS